MNGDYDDGLVDRDGRYIPPSMRQETPAMTYLALPVNARNGSVAEDVTRTFLKAQLRDENSPLRLSGFLAFDIEGFSRPGPDLPYEKVAVQEVVRDQRRLHTYMVHVSLFTSQEAN